MLFFLPLLYNGYVDDLYKKKNKLKRVAGMAYGILYRAAYLLAKRSRFDLLIIEKELFTYCPGFIEQLLLGKTAYVLDFDDNITARYLHHPLLKKILGGKISTLAEKAALVTAGNHWYGSIFSRTTRLKYLPTVVFFDRYQAQPAGLEKSTKPVSIVWIGSPGTARYLTLLEKILASLASDHNIELVVIGANIQIPNIPMRTLQWSAATEAEELSKCHIGIMPLEDTLWEKGKCGFKLIQYMAAGLPVVGSPLPANLEIITEETGFIANDLQEWGEHLSLLINSPELRETMGQAGRKRVKEHYSYERWGPEFVKMIHAIDIRDHAKKQI
ncbi:glycosyltransferase family 4 protein [Chitinophaga barathri]|nr:glycosyltransferase family 4 protein [Chitinophaga barathri]